MLATTMPIQTLAPFFPPEVTDCIIDHCHSDKTALMACGKVCRTWYAASRYHLFSSMEVSGVKWKKFHDLFQEPIPAAITITPFLQELSLHLRMGDDRWLTTLMSAMPEYVPLRTLRIFCHGVQFTNEMNTKFTTTFRSITSLSFFESMLKRRSLAKDVEFMCSFRELDTVLIYGHHRDDMYIDAGVELPTRVHTLKIDLPSPATEGFCRWLLRHRRIPTVSTLRVFRVTDDSNPALQAYLKACKSELADLMVFLYQCRTDLDDFDFHHHTALKNIYLNCNGTSTTQTTCGVLSSIERSYLQNFILRISVFELYRVSDWAPLDEVLTSETFSPSLKVTVAIDEHGEYGADIVARLPKCYARGQLDVVRSGKPNIATSYVEEVYDRMKNF